MSKSTRIAIGGAAGLVLGLVTAFLVEAWDDRLRRRDRAERVTGLPVIAEVPVLPKKQRSNTDVPAVDAPRSRAAERYRVGAHHPAVRPAGAPARRSRSARHRWPAPGARRW